MFNVPGDESPGYFHLIPVNRNILLIVPVIYDGGNELNYIIIPYGMIEYSILPYITLIIFNTMFFQYRHIFLFLNECLQ